MLERLCFSLLILHVLTNDYRVSAASAAEGGGRAVRSAFNNDFDPHVPVENEIGRASYMEVGKDYTLRCMGADQIKERIYWTRNGEIQTNAETQEDQDASTFQSVLPITSSAEARYGCNGIYIYMIKAQGETTSQTSSVWQDSKVICIDAVRGEDVQQMATRVNGYKTQVDLLSNSFVQPFYPIKQIKIDADQTIRCNGTTNWQFIAETRPVTSVEFRDKTVICRNTDTQGRCALTIYFGDKIVAQGVSPVLEYKYGRINIQQVRCTADCDIGEDSITLPVTEIEINRALYIGIIFVIILIILILILIILCVLWHKFGFKEKYGYQINMRLKKNFAVDTNKLSSYRLSGVQAADVPVEADGSDPDVRVKDFGPDQSMPDDDSFVDPNFARGNSKQDMRSKDDISSSGASNPRPFLRI